MGLVTRSSIRLRSDDSRVVSRLFIPGQDVAGGSESRASNTVERILALSETDVDAALEDLLDRFSGRHEDLVGVFDAHARLVVDYLPTAVTPRRRRLLGATFTHEYSIEGASVCNPSFVAHPDQTGVVEGALRIVMSVRAVGEGHHSSIGFRTGEIAVSGELRLDAAHPFPVVGKVRTSQLNRELFHALLRDLGFDGETASSVLGGFGHHFTSVELETAVTKLQSQSDTRLNVEKTVSLLRLIAECFYEVTFEQGTDMSRRVLWPVAPHEGNGMEDARFVMMSDRGVPRFIASYTAYDGHSVSQQLLETEDFQSFRSSPLAGVGSRNKGLAFFPRRVGGRFVALSRYDRETNALAFSSDLHVWDEVVTSQVPIHAWEVVQLGNCGSPLELEQGWLVMTHGVGPMRTYGIGAILLDLEDPTRVIGALPRPLLVPSKDEQDGYVPNVVYSCGSLIHAGILHIPYGIADQSISYASVPVRDVLEAMELPSAAAIA
jgi:predicted GH43/DUF377 family glycosyl hydrolase